MLQLCAHVGDRWPVFCEGFTRWVIEDDFVSGRPQWERVGAQFVPDVAPYQMMKLRLLNGSHLAIAALGRLIGYTYVHETVADPKLSAYMAALMVEVPRVRGSTTNAGMARVLMTKGDAGASGWGGGCSTSSARKGWWSRPMRLPRSSAG
ncbi:mannitol dehydrogenase family protein [Roseomonas populi]|uniref:Mannitol dehydrogenase C-terminal domain-containing protein n=1 Tax=Roseomonas populi TaxID=3121582 RepID=A0ABT1XA38_9PROT|nr:hypothetical protein [Roseomonas pecuniae]MCR0984968.1 hypothetical protein [Roseomonas pecuniae]